ncbi:uncharacterized protein [Arachis hypogaea]|uniref:uncharacterized protein n=1 Tax=Arachis hypogaea TaxID=3818 RepID=UPI003B20CFA4
MTEVRSFLGLVGYYRRFIEGFSRIALPMTKLTSKEVPFVWTSECEKKIQRAQQDEQKLQQLFQPVGDKRREEFTKDEEGLWRYKGRICIPDVGSLKQDLLLEAHNSGFSIHPGSTKMYYDLKKMFWWLGMNGDVATVLGNFPKSLRYEAMSQYRISSTNRWTIGKDYSDAGRYAESICVGSSRELGLEIKTRKLNPRYIGPFEILKRFGPVAYQVALPPHLSNLHDVFHVSQLRKYTMDASHVLEPESIELKENLTFQVTPVRIDDTCVKKLRGKDVSLVKVAWE